MAYNEGIYTILVCGTSLSTGRLSHGWAAKLQRMLNAACRRKVRIIDAGKGSQSSAWPLTADPVTGVVQLDWWKSFRADAAIIEFAVNDAAPAILAGGLTTSLANNNSIIDGLRSNNPAIDITLQTMSPLGPNGATARPNYVGFIQQVRDIAAAKVCRILDNNLFWLAAVPGSPTTQYCLPNDGSWTGGFGGAALNDELHPQEARVDAILIPRLFAHFKSIIDNEIMLAFAQPANASMGTAYSWGTMGLFGANGTAVYSIFSGSLPTGLTLDTTTGQILGTPTTVQVSSFTLRVSDGLDHADYALSITVENNVPSTFDPAALGSGVAISNGNRTITNPFSDSWASGRGAKSYTTGMRYFEISCDGTANVFAGCANANQALSSYLASSSNGFGLFGNGSYRSNGNQVLGTAQAFSTGNRICVAINLDTKQVWFRVGNGNWNNSGSANPTTGTGGFAYTATGAIFPMASMLGSAVTIYTVAAQFAQAVPANFNAWG